MDAGLAGEPGSVSRLGESSEARISGPLKTDSLAPIQRGFAPLSALPLRGNSRKRAAFSMHYAGRPSPPNPGDRSAESPDTAGISQKRTSGSLGHFGGSGVVRRNGKFPKIPLQVQVTRSCTIVSQSAVAVFLPERIRTLWWVVHGP